MYHWPDTEPAWFAPAVAEAVARCLRPQTPPVPDQLQPTTPSGTNIDSEDIAFGGADATMDATPDNVNDLEVPAWLTPAMEQGLAPLEAKIAKIEAKVVDMLDTLERQLAAVRTQANVAATLSAKAYNMQILDGSIEGFKPVPFLDGTYPADHPGIATPICTLAELRTLSVDESVVYYRGYFGENAAVPEDAEGRLEGIRLAVGCMAW